MLMAIVSLALALVVRVKAFLVLMAQAVHALVREDSDVDQALLRIHDDQQGAEAKHFQDCPLKSGWWSCLTGAHRGTSSGSQVSDVHTALARRMAEKLGNQHAHESGYDTTGV